MARKCRSPYFKALITMAAMYALLGVSAHAATITKTATGADGAKLGVVGSIVLIEPDIELSEMTAGGLQEPRQAWSEAARKNYPLAVKEIVTARQGTLKPDFTIPDDLEPTSRLGQILRLNRVVAMSIAQFSATGNVLATKREPFTGRPLLDWSLGDGVSVIRDATGADYALFTYVRDSYASAGRNALRVLAFAAGLAAGSLVDIGGGVQVGIVSLVDLRTGKVVWHGLLVSQTGDLRTIEGSRTAVQKMLKDMPQ
jgi:hypothetical protein